MSVSFKDAYNQSVEKKPVSTPATENNQQGQPVNGNAFQQAYQNSIKKKAPAPVVQDTSDTPSSDSETTSVEPENKSNLFEKINPANIQSPKLNLPSGVKLDVNDNSIIIPYENGISGIQERIDAGDITPDLIEKVSKITNKSKEATVEYLNGNTVKGVAIDNSEKQVKIKSDLTNVINKYNQLTKSAYVPDEVLSSADKTSEFTQKLKEQKDYILNHPPKEHKPQSVTFKANESAIDLSNIMQEPGAFEKFVDETKEYHDLLQKHVINQSIIEGEKNGNSKDQTIKDISRRTNPKEYYRVIKANIPANISPLNSAPALGQIYDKIFGTKEKDELLNSQKGIAEFEYNNGQREIGNNEISQGVLTEDNNLINKGKARIDATESSEDIYLKYPALLRQKMAQEISQELAENAGQVRDLETESYSSKIFGYSKSDAAKTDAFQKYYNNPKTKDIVSDLVVNNIGLLSDASYTGGIFDSFKQPFKELGLGVMDITGFRSEKDIYSDIKKDEMFPKEPENVKTDFTVLDHPFRVRTALNTTANLTGMMAIAIATEGAATGLGASANVSKSLGAYTSFGLPSYDGALKDSYNFLDNDAARTLYATITAVTNAEGGRFLDIGKVVRIPGVSEEFSKIADGLNKESITQKGVRELLDKAENPYVEFAVKYGKNVTKGAATMAYFNISNNIEKIAFGDPNTDAGDILPQAGHAFMDGVLGMGIMGAFGAVSDMRNEKNTTYKGNIYQMAVNHDAAKDVFDIGLRNNTYTQEQYNEKVQILNTAVAAKNAMDAAQQETNITLDQNQKSVYVANKTAEAVLREKANAKGTSEENATKYTEQADRLREQATQTLDGLKFTPTLMPLYDLYEAEKNYDQALENFNTSRGSEEELSLAKENYDTLVNRYFSEDYNKKIAEQESSKPKEKETVVTDENGKEIKPISDTEIKPTFDKAKEFIPAEQATKAQGIIDKVNNAEDINEKDIEDTQDILYDALDKNPEAAHLLEPLITKLQDYEFTTKTETVTTTEKEPVEGSLANKTRRIITPALEQSSGSAAEVQLPDGSVRKGILNIRSGQYVLDIPKGEQIVIGEKAITDRDLKLPSEEKEPEPIKFDADGNVQSVTFETRNGNLVTIKDADKALDLSIQLLLNEQESQAKENAIDAELRNKGIDPNDATPEQRNEIGKNITVPSGGVPDAAFDRAYQEVVKEIQKEVPAKEEKNTEEFSSQSKPIKNGNEKNGKNANEKESSNQQIERGSEKQDGESGKSSSQEQDVLNKPGQQNNEGNAAPLNEGGGKEPPKGKEPISENEADNNDEFTSVRKEKLKEIEGTKELFEERTKKKWSEIYDSAMKNLQKMYPKKSLYDAMLSRVNDFARRLDAGELFNPTSEDIAVFNVFRAETQKRIKDVEGLDSDNNFERLRAIQELDNLNNDLFNIARVTNPEGEAGRAFGMHKSEVALDEDNGLKIRNMQMIKANGGQKLSPEDSKWVADKWEQEKELMKQEQAAKEQSMQEDFNNRVAELEKTYEEKIASLSKGKDRDKTVKQKTLSQKGKNIADQIRKLKKPKDGTNIDLTLGTWDLAVETVAQLVEKGATVAEAIQKMIDDGIVAFREDKDKDEFENRLFDQLKNKKDIGESLDAIKKFSAENDVKDITTDMVKNNLIRDYVNAHVTEVDKKDLLDKSFKDLKEVLPNITKERFVEAYLKEGEFKQPTKKQLEGGIKEQENELKRIAREELSADKQQQIKLENAKRQTEKNIKELKRKLEEGEFEEKQPIQLKKQDAELIQLRRQQANIESEYRKKQRQIEEKNKTGLERVADFVRSSYIAWLIGKPVTLAKVAAMSVVRPVSEAATKLTAGKLFDAVFPKISEVAKRGGESTSLKSIQTGFQAYFKQMGEKGMERMYDKAEEQYNKAAKEYTSYETSANPDGKKLKELKDKMNDKLLKVQGTFLYKFIGGSSLKDALTALVNRSNVIEKQFGHVDTESIKDGNWLDKTNYILGFIGRSHSAAKTFSGRFSFAAGFMARLEGAMANGEDINSGSKILEIAHESYLDWERGKYQQANQITDLWNKMTNHITDGEVGGERELTSKAMAALLKTEVAITRVPVNILHESLMEYTLGAFRALYKIGKVNKEIKKQLKGEGIDPESADFKNALKERINQIDVNEAATIARAFRKGGLGVGLYALALVTGAAHFGIFPHMGQKKKKDEEDLKPDELNPGQVMVGGHKFGEVVSSLIEHVPALWPTFMGLGMAQSYNDEIKKGKTTTEAALESLLTHLSIITHSIPQTKVIDAIGLSKEIHQTVKNGLQGMGFIRSTNIDYSKEELKDPALKSIIDKGVELPTVKPNSIHIKDEKSLTEKKLSEYGTEKVKEFTESRKKFFHEELVAAQQRNTAYVDKYGKASLHGGANKTATAFNKLNKDQLKEILSDLSTKATTKAKKEVFNDSTSHN